MYPQGIATLGDVYGPLSGPTFDALNIVGNPGTTGADLSDNSASAGSVKPISILKNLNGISPFVGLVVVIAVLVGVKVLREWKADESEVKDVKAGLYSTIVVTLMAAAGLPLLKALLAKYHIPGVSDYVLNA